MRRAALALALATLVGCQAIFGIADTTLAPPDGAPGAEDAPFALADAGPAFTVTASPRPLLLVRGGEPRALTLTVTRAPGFTAPVAITTALTPDGISAGQAFVNGGSGTVTVAAAAGFELGPLGITLTATGGGESHPVDVELLIGDAPGAIDTTFGEVAIAPFGATVPYSVSQIVIRPDGRVDVALFALVSGTPHTVVSQLVEGATDTSFATQGMISLAGFAVTALALAPDGALILAGSGDQKASTFLRFDGAGRPDLLFGGAPRPDAGTLANEVVDSRGANPAGLAVQSNGAVVYTHTDANRHVPAVCRLTPAGALDGAFANGAGCWWSDDGDATLVGVALDDSDGIFAGGTWPPSAGLTAFQALHLGAGGKQIGLWQYPDSQLAIPSQTASSVAVSDGKALLAGTQSDGMGGSSGAISRALDDGPDTSFAAGGAVDQFGGDGTTHYNAVAVQADGKVIVVGYEGADSPSSLGIVVRYTAAGAVDSSFGVDGLVTLPTSESLFGVAIAPDGRIVTVGLDQEGNPYVVRLWP